MNFWVWLLQAQFCLPVAQSDHTTSAEAAAILETEHSQPCPNYDLTIICPEIKSLP